MMEDGLNVSYLVLGLGVLMLVIVIPVVVLRWILRVNEIVLLLEKNLVELKMIHSISSVSSQNLSELNNRLKPVTICDGNPKLLP
jgi:hypothetical protein